MDQHSPGIGPYQISEPIFGAGDPTKHFSAKKKGFSVKRGEGFSERGVW